jgi:hypothetical protein
LRGIFFALLLALTALAATGCGTDVDALEYSFDVDSDMNGVLEARAINFHPTDRSPQNLADATEVCGKGYRKAALEWVEDFHLSNVEVSVVRHSPTTCDISVTGEFKRLSEVLSAMLGDDGGEVLELDREMELRVPPDKNVDEALQGTFAIRYRGTVIDHNAEHAVKEEGTMEWSFPYISRHGMYLKIARPEPER